ncbi:MAG: YfcE family phosphodiesterase [Defluviitaleaceae bacterium]|nr:YfcE family phosphodiesterase [Defluviitaleaceae bacterium]
MTRILIFSDTHGDKAGIEQVLPLVKPAVLLHLGDYASDVDDISYIFPKLEIHAITGNSDYRGSAPGQKMIEVAGKTIFMAHGHHFNVKEEFKDIAYGREMRVVTYGQGVGADIVLFGHTHIPYNARQGDIFVLNPGSASLRAANKTYAVIDIFEDGAIRADIHIIPKDL